MWDDFSEMFIPLLLFFVNICNDVNSMNTLSCKHVIRTKEKIITEVMFVLTYVYL